MSEIWERREFCPWCRRFTSQKYDRVRGVWWCGYCGHWIEERTYSPPHTKETGSMEEEKRVRLLGPDPLGLGKRLAREFDLPFEPYDPVSAALKFNPGDALGILGEEGIRVDARTVTFNEAVRLIEQTAWARGLAEGMTEKLVGLKPGDPNYGKAFESIRRRVAEGLARTIVRR